MLQQWFLAWTSAWTLTFQRTTMKRGEPYCVPYDYLGGFCIEPILGANTVTQLRHHFYYGIESEYFP